MSDQPLRLSGFADEISGDLAEQIRVCQATGVTDFELRSVDGTNVLDLKGDTRDTIRKQIQDAGMGVVSIGSPCGKKPVDAGDDVLMDMFKTAIEQADFFEAPFIRVFSFYPPGGEGQGDIEPHREKVIELLQKQADLLESSGSDAVMVHENEKGIYGDVGRRCVDLMQTIDSPKLRTAFDFANFVQCGEHPADNWPALKPFTTHIHIKDAKLDSGEVVPPGHGDGQLAEILKDAYASGYRGHLSMEPHLKVAGHSHGETGPELWQTAVDALRQVCESAGVPLA